MPFNFKEFTISGSRGDTEGTAKFIQEAKGFLEDAGWTTFDDQTAEVGGAHKLIMSSTGEDGSLPTFYIVLISGTGADTTAQNNTSFQVSSNWDAGAHDEGTGAISPDTVSSISSLNTRSGEDYKVWMSGDSQGIVFVTRQDPSTHDSICIGRANQFHTTVQDPYPMYINGSNTSAVFAQNTVNVRGLAGNPPKPLLTSSDGEILGISMDSNNQPYNISGVTSVFFAWPLIFTFDDGGDPKRGVIGTLRNAWQGVGSDGGVFDEGTLIASGTDFGKQIYRAFVIDGEESLIIRQE